MTDTPELTLEEFHLRFRVVITRGFYKEKGQYEIWVRGMQALTGASMVNGTINHLSDNWDKMTPEEHAQIFALAALVFQNT